MVRDILGVALIGLFYLCCLVVIFAPTLYAGWFYLVSRRLAIRHQNLARVFRVFLYTACINIIVAYFGIHLIFDYFLVAKAAESQASVVATMQNAITAEEKFFTSYGRYYAVGPVRGPYQDEHGLNVGKDVILEVTPSWDLKSQKERFSAHAVHVWGREILTNSGDGKVREIPPDSEESERIRAKLLRSVK
jgi:hypothetical protein